LLLCSSEIDSKRKNKCYYLLDSIYHLERTKAREKKLTLTISLHGLRKLKEEERGESGIGLVFSGTVRVGKKKEKKKKREKGRRDGESLVLS